MKLPQMEDEKSIVCQSKKLTWTSSNLRILLLNVKMEIQGLKLNPPPA